MTSARKTTLSTDNLQSVVAARFRIAAVLTVVMIAIYFGFVALVAFNKELLGRLVTKGLSLGILLGALVIVLSWITTLIYVRWTNRHYDPYIDELRKQ